MADSHIRIEEGGWTRQTTVRELPASVELASVQMRLDKGVIRELHWHKGRFACFDHDFLALARPHLLTNQQRLSGHMCCPAK